MPRSSWGRPTLLASVLALLAACSTKRATPPAAGEAAADAAAAPRGPDLAALTRDVAAAAARGDAAAVLDAIAAQCGGSCPCLDPARGGDAACAVGPLGPSAAGVPPAWAWAGKFVADLAAHASDVERTALAGALAQVVAWAPPAVTVQPPAVTHAVDPGAWGVVVIAADGALSVGGSARLRLSLDGATADPAAPLAPVADPAAARAALAAIDPRRASSPDAGAPPAVAASPCAAIGGASGDGTLAAGHGGLGLTPRVRLVAGGGGGVVVIADARASSRRVFDVLRATYGDRRLGVLAGGRVAALAVTVCDGGTFDLPTGLDVEAATSPADVRAAYDRASPPAAGAIDLRLSNVATAADLVGALGAVLDAGATRIGFTPAGTVNGHIAYLPAVHLAQPAVVGALDTATVRRWLKHDVSRLMACYETALTTSPTLEGEATATFTVSPTGAVARATVTGLTSAFDACATRVIRTIAFPPPKDGGKVEATCRMTFGFTGR